jgi:hypothetical protein
MKAHRVPSIMPLTIQSHHGPITSPDDWAAAIPLKQWKNGRSARELARAWWPTDRTPSVPAEFATLLDGGGFPGLTLDTVHVNAAIAVDDATWHADLAIRAHCDDGPLAMLVEAVADERFGDRLGNVLVDAAREIGRDEPSAVVARVQRLAAALLPPWREGLPHLEDVRHDLLMGAAAAMAFAESIGATRALYLVHELVYLDRTKESDRRKNREDLDLLVRRLSHGEQQRLTRGVLIGPLAVPGYPAIGLQVGKVRRDLDG